MYPAMPLQQISVTPLDWQKEGQRSEVSEQEWKRQREPVYTATAGPERCTSQASTLSNNYDICRICHCEGDPDAPLIAPCYCSGSLRYVHQACLQQWIKSSDIRCCELCKFEFIMQSKVKPFMQWERLDMSPIERRRLSCSVTFHSMAIICVLWSLYVLVDRTLEEVNNGMLDWPFWTKLIVVAIGFTGAIVFVSIQCRSYLQLLRRWRAFNRVIYVQNAPEKVALKQLATPSLVMSQESLLMSGACCGVVPVDMSATDMQMRPVARSASAVELCDNPKHLPPPGELPVEALALALSSSAHNISVTSLEPLSRRSVSSLNSSDLNDIAPPPAAFSDSIDDGDPPSPAPIVTPSPISAPLASSYAFPLSRLGSARFSAGYPLLLSTFHPTCTPEGRYCPSGREQELHPRPNLPPSEDVAITIRPWTVGGSYFLHPAQSGHGVSERWLESRGSSDVPPDSLSMDAASEVVPLASLGSLERRMDIRTGELQSPSVTTIQTFPKTK